MKADSRERPLVTVIEKTKNISRQATIT